MFRVSQFIREIFEPTPADRRRDPPGPVVIWNLGRRCNLTCRHCYSLSADTDFAGELSTDEVFRVMDDLKAFHVPALILSGGEPLMRADIFDISRRAKEMGFYVGLSTNGTLIDEDRIGPVTDIGYDYVGISIDGMEATHDRFRRRDGAFCDAMRGVRLCRDAGLKVGLRFTLTQHNQYELPALLDLLDAERIDKFYLSHLNYAGRGNHNRGSDAAHDITRRAMDILFARCLDDYRTGRAREVVTGNNDADGVYLWHWVRARFPDAGDHIRAKLVQWGGNASGVNVANIDNLGHVHADTMWWHHSLGTVRTRAFGDIWMDLSDPLMAGLKARPRPVEGRCAACRHLDICGGNTRVRAEQITGNPWAEDPACYLSDEEIGVDAPHQVHTVPFARCRQAAGG